MLKKPLLTIFLVLTIVVVSLGQATKPKVALVLAGGGAKGFAHLPAMHIMDSLNIVPDLIVGTSIGSIFGGLYSMGYTANDIYHLADDINWSLLLKGVGFMSDVGVEEKSEYERYLAEIQIQNGRIKPVSFILNDQKILSIFNYLTSPVYDVSDFDDLPIPFRAVCTDIVNEKMVVLDSGSLAIAMRASMSIPGVFEPVPYENTLLIDGGVLNNFAVEIAREMGADIVIGSDLGILDIPKEELDDIPSILFQASMINSNLKHKDAQNDCDILIDNAPNLTFSTGDFPEWRTIYEEGKVAAYAKLDEFVKLSEDLKKYEKRSIKRPSFESDITLDKLEFISIAKESVPLVRNKLNLVEGDTYHIGSIANGIDEVMGTTLFNNVYYQLTDNEGKTELLITGNERSKHMFHSSLHYNTQTGVGLELNYTGRNIIGNSSRSIVSVDIAESPKMKIQYQQNIKANRDFWWSTQLFGQLLTQDLLFKGRSIDYIQDNYLLGTLEINKNLNPLKSYVGIGISYEYATRKPELDPDIRENIFNFEKYNYRPFELAGNYHFNSLDKPFFPTKGLKIKARLATALFNNLDYRRLNNPELNVNGRTNNYTKLEAEFMRCFNLSNKNTVHFGMTGAFIFDHGGSHEDFQTFGIGSFYRIGGNLPDYRKNMYAFSGLKFSELFVTQFLNTHIDYQFDTKRDFIITPHIDIATVGYDDFTDYIGNAFFSTENWEELQEPSLLFSLGSTISYESILGPINLDVSWVNGINKLRWFLGVGYQFN